MAMNKLTPEQDLMTRDFFLMIANEDSYLSKNPSMRRTLITTLLHALNYNWLPNGSFIDKDTTLVMQYGTSDYSKYPNEWDTDKERASAQVNSKGTPETSSSESAESAEVRETVLSEDV
jgi:hypothetical protein